MERERRTNIHPAVTQGVTHRGAPAKPAAARFVGSTKLLSTAEIAAMAKPALPREPGIYFLMLDGAVQYVGQSRSVGKRVGGHHASTIPFDSWAFIPCPANDLLTLEARYIAYFDPPSNIIKPAQITYMEQEPGSRTTEKALRLMERMLAKYPKRPKRR